MAHIVESMEILTSAKTKLVQAEQLLALNIKFLQQLQLHVAEDIGIVESELKRAQQALGPADFAG
ncbi:hypothetical protein [Paenibacillus agilis]|uniref:Uncharacterized protein n=1 Tax=Paenibacillus agilis TaxID=3020863 RepID=A0A559IX88_9BACL|nr:hypothetical protein [Paenibacillus agilis]TVX92242.1 hypothetical protein FPZ44_03705 [Paenibacillus agilis]